MPVNFRETAVYRACVDSGLIPRGSAAMDQGMQVEDRKDHSSSLPALPLTLKVEGMWCPTCAWLIEEVLGKTRGLVRCQVLFSADLAQIEYLPHIVTPHEIMTRISRLGYRPALFVEEEESSPERKALLIRLGISAILTLNIMMISFTLDYGFFEDLTQKGIGYLSWPLGIMAAPVLFYGGWPILKKGLVGLRYGAASMETLISLGALSAYVYSFFQVFRGSLHLYFDTASMLITLVLLGKYIEVRAKEKASKGVIDLYQLANQKVRLCSRFVPLRDRAATQAGAAEREILGGTKNNEGRTLSDPPRGNRGSERIEKYLTAALPPSMAENRSYALARTDLEGEPAVSPAKGQVPAEKDWDGGGERWIPSSDVKIGDEFLVVAGERVAVDGEIIAGQGNLDESILTGEAKPVKKTISQEIMSGSLLLDGELILKAVRTSRESTLGRWVTLMREALAKKNPAEILADRITRRFVPAILLIALGTAIYVGMARSSLDEALLRSLTVLVISCPCALGLATPLAKVAAMGRSRSQGILVRDPASLERAKDLTALVLDKTGTLTEGRFALQEIISLHGPEGDLLARLASLEAHSEHFIARAVVRKAQEESLDLDPVSAFEEIAGMGVRGIVREMEIFAGNRQWLSCLGAVVPDRLERQARTLEAEAKTVVFFGWARRVEGFLVLGDSVKEGVRQLVQDLQTRGTDLWLVSGDSTSTTQAVAKQTGILQFKGQVLPQDKVKLIKGLQAKGARVGMVGDGINDAPALAQADVGFTLGAATGITQQAADFILLGSDPRRILDVLRLSSSAVKAIRQNLFFAFFYNALAIPLALSGLVNPIIAVLAMFVSSLTVIGNALRVGRPAD